MYAVSQCDSQSTYMHFCGIYLCCGVSTLHEYLIYLNHCHEHLKVGTFEGIYYFANNKKVSLLMLQLLENGFINFLEPYVSYREVNGKTMSDLYADVKVSILTKSNYMLVTIMILILMF
jgi:hypothetical protein